MIPQMQLKFGPVTFTTPSSSTRYYFTPAVTSVNGEIETLVAYSDPDSGNANLQPQAYLGYTITKSGSVTQTNGYTDWINASSPQAVPAHTLNYQIKAFNGSSSGSVFSEYFDTINQDGTATFQVADVDVSGANPVVTELPDSITVTPVSKTLTDNITAELANLYPGNSLNEQLFEVEGAPSPGEVQGTFMIFNATGNVVVGPTTGFEFTDGKAHVFAIGPKAFGTNPVGFIEAVEVWNQTTRLADVQIDQIDATTGAATLEGTLPTELGSITKLSFQFIGTAPNATGVIGVGAGTSSTGQNGFTEIVTSSTPTNGTFNIQKELFVPYSGQVTQDARIFESGISNEYVVDWVDGDGLTLELIDSNLNVLEIYKIPEANGTSTLADFGNGKLLVDYRVGSSSTSAVDDFVILDTTPNAAPPPGTTADMIMSQASTGDYEIYDIGNNSVLAAHPLTNVQLPWQPVDVGGFNGSDTSDLLLRNSSTGAFEIYDVSRNNASSPTQLGAVGTDWSVLGFGDFSGNPGETDMLMRQSGTAKLEVYDISNNQITNAAGMGAVGPEWNFLGVGDFSSNANETDLPMRNSNNGALEVYNINHNAIISASPMGAIGVEWSFVGVGDFSGNPGETDMLMRNSNTGALEVYNVHNDQIVSANAMGAIGAEWSLVGIGDFSGNPGETDMITRNANTGAFEIYDISHDSIVSASSIGAVGTDWQAAGIAPYQSGSGAAASSANSLLDSATLATDPVNAGPFWGAAPAAEVSAPTWTAATAAPPLAGALFQPA